MEKRIYLILFISSLWFTNQTNAQVRQDLNTGLTSVEKDTLVALMQQYIDTQVLQYHCDYVDETNGAQLDIHSDFDFLPFHRVYIEGLEDFLTLKGHPEFVPLPSWAPNTATPSAFQVVDSDCASASAICDNGVTNNSSIDCSTSINWSPGSNKPSYLTLPTGPGTNDDLCDWPFSPDTAGMTDPGGLSRNLEGPYHNGVHGAMGGAMGWFTSPAAPIFWNWHAYVDDIWKEWECNCPSSQTQSVDLYMKDNPKVMEDWRDRGEEPSLDPNNLIYLSEDMWIRRDSTSGFSNDEHLNAQFDTTLAGPSLAYVYVRVRNRGCDTSLGTEQLSLHWSKAFLAGVSWPTGWNGGTTGGGVLMGDLIGSQSIPQIPPGGQTIMRFTWSVPDPQNYNGISTEPWHFCLAGRVVATNDPMAVPEGPSIAVNTVNNNNIVWKNVSVIRVDQIQGMAPGGVVGAGNIFSDADQNVFLEFNMEENNTPITDVAEVYATLDQTLFDVWDRGGRQGKGIQLFSEEKRMIRILDDGATLRQMNFEPKEWGTIKVSFNFFSNDYRGNEEFKLYLTQNETANGAITGGELFDLRMHKRYAYDAQISGGDQVVSKNETVTLDAKPIGEPAVYEWYNSNGEFIGKGKTIQFVPPKSDVYKLRTIALEDGFVDYATVAVDVVYNAIKSLVPNPATTQLTVTYDARSAKTAEIRIQESSGAYQYTYPVSTKQNSVSIDVAHYKKGIYTVMLIHDGAIVDTKQLSIF